MTSRRGPRAAAIVALVVATHVAPAPAAAQARASEPAVKAAYLFNFAQFVRWPVGSIAAGRPFTVCVIGRDPFGSALDSTLANESVDGHPTAVRRLTSPADAGACQLVFIGTSEESRVEPVLRAIADKPVLTVSDIPRFIELGGMIQFVSIDRRVRFEINLDATAAARLAPSSELARVAVAVRRAQPAE